MKTRTIVSIAVGLIVPGLFWLSGVDFDRRGLLQAYAVFGGLFFAGYAYVSPWSYKDEKEPT